MSTFTDPLPDCQLNIYKFKMFLYLQLGTQLSLGLNSISALVSFNTMLTHRYLLTQHPFKHSGNDFFCSHGFLMHGPC